MRQLDTYHLLTQWGIWLRYGGGLPGYVSPHYALIRDNIEQHDERPCCMITEDLCMLMDRIVARLIIRNNAMGKALVLFYGRDISYATLGRIMDIPKTRAESLVKSGEIWVDAVIDDRLAAA
jgi:hypothetical protein